MPVSNMPPLPQEFADIFASASKNWSDNDVVKYKTHKYKLLPDKTVVRLMKIFQMCMWNSEKLPSRPFSQPYNFAEITVAMASQLMSKELTPMLTSENPKLKDFNYPSYVSDPKIIPELSNEFLDAKKEEFLAEKGGEFSLFDIWMKKMPLKVQVAVNAYIATVCLRVCLKRVHIIHSYMQRELRTSVTKHYGTYISGEGVLPLPSAKFLSTVASKFQIQTPICGNFFATCLQIYSIEFAITAASKKIGDFYDKTGIIANAILTTTAGNGLNVVTVAFNILNTGKATNLCIVNTIHQTLLKGNECSAKATVLKVEKFRNRYSPHKYHLNCHPSLSQIKPLKRDILWPWARILDATYFKDLQPDSNCQYLASMVAFCSANTGGARWFMAGVKDLSTETKQAFLDWAEPIQEELGGAPGSEGNPIVFHTRLTNLLY